MGRPSRDGAPRDGREVGFLSCNTAAAAALTAGHRDLIGLLGGILGEVADVTGELAARHGGDVVVHAGGPVEVLPGGSLPDDRLLRRALAALVVETDMESAFLVRGARPHRWWRIRVVPVRGERCAVVHIRNDAAPRGPHHPRARGPVAPDAGPHERPDRRHARDRAGDGPHARRACAGEVS